jgi:GntR family transcriptional regulator
MPFDINPVDPRPIYVQVMDEIRRGIVVGTWRADEALPSVRQLAGDLRLNPNTVQQAYRELERDGVVYVRRGQGTFVSAQDTGGQRRALLQELARRVLQEAHRHGFRADELVNALTEETAGRDGRTTNGKESRR